MDKNINEKISHYAKKIYCIRLLGGKCSHCGEERYQCLTFHHKDPIQKEFNITIIRAGRLSKILKEVEKCDLLCYNCHAKIHISETVANRKKNKKIYLEYKKTDSCINCGETEPNCLHFHHRNPEEKGFLLSSKANLIESIDKLPDKIKKELDKCDVLCGNCHQDHHFDKEFYEEYKDIILERSYNIKEIQAPLDKEEVVSLYDSGMRPIDIANHFNASKGTICDILKKFGKTKSKESIKNASEQNIKNIIELNNNGLTPEEISKELNLSKSHIFNIIRENNLVSNKGPLKPPPHQKFNLTKEELKELLKTYSLRQIGNMYNLSGVAILKWKRKFEL